MSVGESIAAEDIIVAQVVDDSLHIIFEFQLILVDIAHQKRSDVIGGCREHTTLLLVHVANHKEHIQHTLAKFAVDVV